MAKPDNEKAGAGKPGEFYKPYRIKPAEVYVELNHNVCNPNSKPTK
ncbi:hypothetical protein [Desulfallas thermosapovorans]|uniref:Uncharacterized protein n=1 Tax=Desulfallas thermosapovorans DSM 6562 TaxID=1121431 RepID=A0A5S4ZQ56_9FIRM|nr:hypothetical protein [Desulfallas thermosapovorans]TYO94924.1 hypothetical protein LX24_01939 [Desulfallas thermosapovorans DSM 6562]